MSNTFSWGISSFVETDETFHWGIFPIYATAESPGVFVAEILIDNTIIWSSQNQTPQQTIDFDVSSYEGKHELKFRIRRVS